MYNFVHEIHIKWHLRYLGETQYRINPNNKERESSVLTRITYNNPFLRGRSRGTWCISGHLELMPGRPLLTISGDTAYISIVIYSIIVTML